MTFRTRYGIHKTNFAWNISGETVCTHVLRRKGRPCHWRQKLKDGHKGQLREKPFWNHKTLSWKGDVGDCKDNTMVSKRDTSAVARKTKERL